MLKHNSGLEELVKSPVVIEKNTPSSRVISFFGGSHFKSIDPEYRDVEELAASIAHRGWDVMTGGYLGLMEAASKGARRAEGVCGPGSR